MNTSAATIAMPRWTSSHSAGLQRDAGRLEAERRAPVSRSRRCTTRPASSTAERATWLWPSAPEVATAVPARAAAVSE